MSAAAEPTITELVAALRELGVQRVHSYAWRDLDDPDAGGSEVHADEILRRWAAAGLAVHHRTSSAGAPRVLQRNGYTVEQRGGRYSVFAKVLAKRIGRRPDPSVVTLEIWNGVPWFSPWWAGKRRVVWMHHVHEDMWSDVLPRPFDLGGKLLETRFAPLFYKRNPMVTLSDSSRREIESLGLPPERIAIIPPGVGDHFVSDAAARASNPHVVAVGRLAPVKRFQEVLAAAEAARRTVPDLTLEIVGEGAMRPGLEQWIAEHDAAGWATLRGRVTDAELVQAYQRAWVVVSASSAEGWGMSLTEAATCGTPSVATDIPGHRDSVVHGVTGELVPSVADLGPAIAALVLDEDRRRRYAEAAHAHATSNSWDAVAQRQLAVLVDVCRSVAGNSAS